MGILTRCLLNPHFKLRYEIYYVEIGKLDQELFVGFYYF